MRTINQEKYPRNSLDIIQDDLDLYEKVFLTIEEKLGIQRIKLCAGNKLITDLQADSLDQVELVMAFEDQFEIEITDEEVTELGSNPSIMDIVMFLKKKI